MADDAVYENDYAAIDARDVSSGNVRIKHKTDTAPKIKVQITKDGGVVYTYNLPANDTYYTFPFSEGNGAYTVNVFKQLAGTQYAQVLGKTLAVSMDSELSPFLRPNIYVNFSKSSAMTSKANDLCLQAASQLKKVDAVYHFIVNNFQYDTAKAKTVQSGYIPNAESTFLTKTGICFDYASVMASMLRAQGIPTKLVVGYTGEAYHAWISVYIKDVGWIDEIIKFDGKSWRMMDPTFASSGKGDKNTAEYVANPSNYQERFCY